MADTPDPRFLEILEDLAAHMAITDDPEWLTDLAEAIGAWQAERDARDEAA